MTDPIKVKVLMIDGDEAAAVTAALEQGDNSVLQKIVEQHIGEEDDGGTVALVTEDGIDKYIGATNEGTDMRERFLTDVITGVHFLLHDGQQKRAQAILCATEILLSKDTRVVPEMCIKASMMLVTELNAVNLEREKADCGGSA